MWPGGSLGMLAGVGASWHKTMSRGREVRRGRSVWSPGDAAMGTKGLGRRSAAELQMKQGNWTWRR